MNKKCLVKPGIFFLNKFEDKGLWLLSIIIPS